MTAPSPLDTLTAADAADPPEPDLAALAAAAGLTVLAGAAWPASSQDAQTKPPSPPGFIISSFSPMAAEAARRCLEQQRKPVAQGPDTDPAGEPDPVVAVVIVSSLGDLGIATHVAAAVDRGDRLGPLLFFQCIPNAVAGHIASGWGLRGPVVCLADGAGALAAAAALIEDGDADQALVVAISQEAEPGSGERAQALLVGRPDDMDPDDMDPDAVDPDAMDTAQPIGTALAIQETPAIDEPPASGQAPAAGEAQDAHRTGEPARSSNTGTDQHRPAAAAGPHPDPQFGERTGL